MIEVEEYYIPTFPNAYFRKIEIWSETDLSPRLFRGTVIFNPNEALYIQKNKD